jgi:hypothetical protein
MREREKGKLTVLVGRKSPQWLKLAKSHSNHEEIAREEEKMERNWRNGEGEPRAVFCVSFR